MSLWLRGPERLLAMQEIEGSTPSSGSTERWPRGLRRPGANRDGPAAHRGSNPLLSARSSDGPAAERYRLGPGVAVHSTGHCVRIAVAPRKWCRVARHLFVRRSHF